MEMTIKNYFFYILEAPKKFSYKNLPRKDNENIQNQ